MVVMVVMIVLVGCRGLPRDVVRIQQRLRVFDLLQAEAAGRGHLARRTPVARDENGVDLVGPSVAAADLDQQAHEVADHVMQEAVGPYMEYTALVVPFKRAEVDPAGVALFQRPSLAEAADGSAMAAVRDAYSQPKPMVRQVFAVEISYQPLVLQVRPNAAVIPVFLGDGCGYRKLPTASHSYICRYWRARK